MSFNRNPKILMFGWEFPPYNSGGLGVACQGLVNGLASAGAAITFVLPRRLNCQSDSCKFIFADHLSSQKVEFYPINSILSPYSEPVSYKKYFLKIFSQGKTRLPYAGDLFSEVLRYADAVRDFVSKITFDVIHAHDWLTVPAAIMAKKISGKPLIFQVHATEYDRCGEWGANRDICFIEKEGLRLADKVIAVSDYTKRMIVDHYGIDERKIQVVPNAVNRRDFNNNFDLAPIKKQGAKIVLFVGRLAFQKGPDYFLQAAKIALEYEPNTYFVISGAGDMQTRLISDAARLGIADHVIFAGFLRDADLVRAYHMADVYVMPSVSDPFGLTALEAMTCGTPVLVSRQTGVSEMLSHCLKVDFWDTREIAAKIIALLRYPALSKTLSQNGNYEINKFSWDDSANKCLNIYQEVMTA